MKSVFDVVVRPVISEKADTQRDEGGAYAFEVHPGANKFEIKKAIETIYKVPVEEVRTVVVRGKFKRVGTTSGQKKNWKKAMVKLKAGHRINLFEGA
jgi:large subunit ribosomal protein L23